MTRVAAGPSGWRPPPSRRPSEQSLWVIAVHEAGHAVAATHLGIPVEAAVMCFEPHLPLGFDPFRSLEENRAEAARYRSGLVGCVTTTGPPGRLDERVIVALAGIEAERALAGELGFRPPPEWVFGPDRLPPASSDLRAARFLAAHRHGPHLRAVTDALRSLHRAARSLLRRPDVRWSVRAVAAALIERRLLTADEVTELVARQRAPTGVRVRSAPETPRTLPE